MDWVAVLGVPEVLVVLVLVVLVSVVAPEVKVVVVVASSDLRTVQAKSRSSSRIRRRQFVLVRHSALTAPTNYNKALSTTVLQAPSLP